MLKLARPPSSSNSVMANTILINLLLTIFSTDKKLLSSRVKKSSSKYGIPLLTKISGYFYPVCMLRLWASCLYFQLTTEILSTQLQYGSNRFKPSHLKIRPLFWFVTRLISSRNKSVSAKHKHYQRQLILIWLW
jgi:hypothetical protein